jgi:molecular chaperone DnaJ
LPGRPTRERSSGPSAGLARELHPDVSEAPDAQERFREVVEAYEALSKRETRELYDRFGHAGLRGGGFTPTQFDFGSLNDLFAAFFGDDLFGVGGRATRSRGADLAVQVEIELVEAASGIKREVPFPVAVTCGTCAGSGAAPGTSPVTCETCGGAGRLQRVSRSAFGEFVAPRPVRPAGARASGSSSPAPTAAARAGLWRNERSRSRSRPDP